MPKPSKLGRKTHATNPAPRKTAPDLAACIKAFAESVRANYDTSPVTKSEWDKACGDTRTEPLKPSRSRG